ncbi:WHG domain-containing protein [Ligilactobacillus equi]|nr:WHG domain-containing protein [Ligilactobacillus equi]
MAIIQTISKKTLYIAAKNWCTKSGSNISPIMIPTVKNNVFSCILSIEHPDTKSGIRFDIMFDTEDTNKADSLNEFASELVSIVEQAINEDKVRTEDLSEFDKLKNFVAQLR